MKEIDVIGWILNSELLLSKTLTMIESQPDAKHKEQKVNIKNVSKSISDMKLYCFNSADIKERLFPFFNHRMNAPKAPKDLNRFCDYILLVQHVNGLFVFFLEMKRGTKEGADEQINASCTFFDFILESAERIKKINNFSKFDKNQIYYRKIIIRECHSNKIFTKNNSVEDMDFNSIITHNCTNEFRPIVYCKQNKL